MKLKFNRDGMCSIGGFDLALRNPRDRWYSIVIFKKGDNVLNISGGKKSEVIQLAEKFVRDAQFKWKKVGENYECVYCELKLVVFPCGDGWGCKIVEPNGWSGYCLYSFFTVEDAKTAAQSCVLDAQVQL